MKEKLKLIGCIIIVLVLLGLIGIIVYNGVNSVTKETTNPVATFEIQDYGTIKMELYPEYAPNTVSNIIALIESGFYNNKVIYGKDDVKLYIAKDDSEDSKGPTVSLIDDSVEADSDGDYEYEINGEFVANKFEQNTLRHEKGILTLNRSDYSSYGLTDESYNSGNSQFSVIMSNNEISDLNGVYCAFGKVIEGLDILEKIYNESDIAKKETEEEQTETENETIETEEDEEDEEDEGGIKKFADMPVITNATVEKYGIDYGKPEVHEKFDVQSYLNELYSQYYTN